MNDKPNHKYQTGQQLFIRVRPDDLAFQVRVKGYSENTQQYCIQRIGHNNTVFMSEVDLDSYIAMVDLM